MTAIIEVFSTPNKKTKTGNPQRWRWRIDEDERLGRPSSSFGSPNRCLMDIARNAEVPIGAVLHVEGKDAVPWVM